MGYSALDISERYQTSSAHHHAPSGPLQCLRIQLRDSCYQQAGQLIGSHLQPFKNAGTLKPTVQVFPLPQVGHCGWTPPPRFATPIIAVQIDLLWLDDYLICTQPLYNSDVDSGWSLRSLR